jgi:PAS domain S-box-containing protein
MIGAIRSEIVGRAFWDTPWWEHDAALQERLRAGIARAAKGEFVRFEAQHPRSDGVMATVDFSLTPIRGADGAVEVLFAEGVEITDQRRAESELRDSEVQYSPSVKVRTPQSLRRTRGDSYRSLESSAHSSRIRNSIVSRYSVPLAFHD